MSPGQMAVANALGRYGSTPMGPGNVSGPPMASYGRMAGTPYPMGSFGVGDSGPNPSFYRRAVNPQAQGLAMQNEVALRGGLAGNDPRLLARRPDMAGMAGMPQPLPAGTMARPAQPQGTPMSAARAQPAPAPYTGSRTALYRS